MLRRNQQICYCLRVCRYSIKSIKSTSIVRQPLIPAPFSQSSYFHTLTTWLQEKNQKATPTAIGKVDKPLMMIAFTCKKCNHRSSHTMSKQAYTNGTVLIQCPSCHARHLIADHLKIFSDDHITIEDILKAKGESVSLTTEDLAFEDIPETLKGTLGKYAKGAENNKQYM